MSSATEFLRCYTELAAIVARMVEFARTKDWAPLPALDTECTAIVERLRAMPPPRAISSVERCWAKALVERIRADQDELASLVQPQLARLMRRIDEMQLEQKVRGTYGVG
jgi:flagellar protein FliT